MKCYFRDGKEFQQLSAIRQLPQLLDTDGENARDQLIPVIQNTLKVGRTLKNEIKIYFLERKSQSGHAL